MFVLCLGLVKIGQPGFGYGFSFEFDVEFNCNNT